MGKNGCRLCLNCNSTVTVFLNDSIIRDIKLCCNIQVDFYDKLPKYICISCSDKVDSIIKFKKMCEYNDKILHETLDVDGKVEPKGIECKSLDKNMPDEKNHSSNLNNKYISIVDKKNESYLKNMLFKCELCGININKNNIKNHFPNGPEDRKFPCKYCKSTCVSRTCYRTHIKTHIRIDSKIIKRRMIRKIENNCCFCGMLFKDVSKFAKHLRDHKPQPYQCDICCKSFKFKVHLSKHLQAHTQLTKSCVCHHCGKIFKNPYIAQKHIKNHLLSNLIKCEVCGKMMKKSSIKQHVYTHKGEKNFECDICKQKFISKTCVRSHMVTHIGTKPFECKFCGVKFASRKTFTDHEKLHTGERPHNCPVCNKGFIQISNMKSHFKNNHKGVEFVYKNKKELKRELLVF